MHVMTLIERKVRKTLAQYNCLCLNFNRPMGFVLACSYIFITRSSIRTRYRIEYGIEIHEHVRTFVCSYVHMFPCRNLVRRYRILLDIFIAKLQLISKDEPQINVYPYTVQAYVDRPKENVFQNRIETVDTQVPWTEILIRIQQQQSRDQSRTKHGGVRRITARITNWRNMNSMMERLLTSLTQPSLVKMDQFHKQRASPAHKNRRYTVYSSLGYSAMVDFLNGQYRNCVRGTHAR